MKAAHGIYASFAILVLGGGGVYLSRLDKQSQAAALSAAATPRGLPHIALAKADTRKITKIELTEPNDDDKSRLHTTVLERLGQDWEMTSPSRTRASLSKVESLVDNLTNLHPWVAIDGGASLYDKYDLTEAKALHIVVWKGPEKAIDLYCGKSDAQGQIARLAGRDGVFVLVNWGAEGYSGFLYTRDVRSWRETSIITFQEGDAVRVEITNPNGVFSFTRSQGGKDGWTGSLARRRRDGKLAEPERAWQRFDGSKVEDLVRTYKTLDTDDFGEDEDRASSGVDQAESTGGVVRIKLKNNAPDLVVKVGKPSMRNSRWAIKDSRWAIKDGGDGTLYTLSPWAASWATAGASKFESTDKFESASR